MDPAYDGSPWSANVGPRKTTLKIFTESPTTRFGSTRRKTERHTTPARRKALCRCGACCRLYKMFNCKLMKRARLFRKRSMHVKPNPSNPSSAPARPAQSAQPAKPTALPCRSAQTAQPAQPALPVEANRLLPAHPNPSLAGPSQVHLIPPSSARPQPSPTPAQPAPQPSKPSQRFQSASGSNRNVPDRDPP